MSGPVSIMDDAPFGSLEHILAQRLARHRQDEHRRERERADAEEQKQRRTASLVERVREFCDLAQNKGVVPVVSVFDHVVTDKRYVVQPRRTTNGSTYAYEYDELRETAWLIAEYHDHTDTGAPCGHRYAIGSRTRNVYDYEHSWYARRPILARSLRLEELLSSGRTRKLRKKPLQSESLPDPFMLNPEVRVDFVGEDWFTLGMAKVLAGEGHSIRRAPGA